MEIQKDGVEFGDDFKLSEQYRDFTALQLRPVFRIPPPTAIAALNHPGALTVTDNVDVAAGTWRFMYIRYTSFLTTIGKGNSTRAMLCRANHVFGVTSVLPDGAPSPRNDDGTLQQLDQVVLVRPSIVKVSIDTQATRELISGSRISNELVRSGASPNFVELYHEGMLPVPHQFLNNRRWGFNVAGSCKNIIVLSIVAREPALNYNDLRAEFRNEVAPFDDDDSYDPVALEAVYARWAARAGDVAITIQEDAGTASLLRLTMALEPLDPQNAESPQTAVEDLWHRRSITLQLVTALHQLHKLRLVHADLQARNIIFKPSTAKWNTYYSVVAPQQAAPPPSAQSPTTPATPSTTTTTAVTPPGKSSAAIGVPEQRFLYFISGLQNPNTRNAQQTRAPLVAKLIDFETVADLRVANQQNNRDPRITSQITQIGARAPEQIVPSFDNVVVINSFNRLHNDQRITPAMDAFSLGMNLLNLYIGAASFGPEPGANLSPLQANLAAQNPPTILTSNYLKKRYPLRYNAVSQVAAMFVESHLMRVRTPAQFVNKENFDLSSNAATIAEREFYVGYLTTLVLLMGRVETPEDLGIDNTTLGHNVQRSFTWQYFFLVFHAYGPQSPEPSMVWQARARLTEMFTLFNVPGPNDRARRRNERAEITNGIGVLEPVLRDVLQSNQVPPTDAELISSLLQWNPNQRATMYDLLQNPQGMLRTHFATRETNEAEGETAHEFEATRVASDNSNEVGGGVGVNLHRVFGDHVSRPMPNGQIFLPQDNVLDERKRIGDALLERRIDRGGVERNEYGGLGPEHCAYCARPQSTLQCSGCPDAQVTYCGRTCQQMHWNYDNHGQQCFHSD